MSISNIDPGPAQIQENYQSIERWRSEMFFTEGWTGQMALSYHKNKIWFIRKSLCKSQVEKIKDQDDEIDINFGDRQSVPYQ